MENYMTQFTIPEDIREELRAVGYEDEIINQTEAERNDEESIVFQMTTEQLEGAIEATKEAIVELQEAIDLSDAIKRLEQSDDWKAFEKAYFTDEKDRLVTVLTSGDPVEKNTKEEVTEKLLAIGSLNNFLKYKTADNLIQEHRNKIVVFKLDLANYNFVLEEKLKNKK